MYAYARYHNSTRALGGYFKKGLPNLKFRYFIMPDCPTYVLISGTQGDGNVGGGVML